MGPVPADSGREEGITPDTGLTLNHNIQIPTFTPKGNLDLPMHLLMHVLQLEYQEKSDKDA